MLTAGVTDDRSLGDRLTAAEATLRATRREVDALAAEIGVLVLGVRAVLDALVLLDRTLRRFETHDPVGKKE